MSDNRPVKRARKSAPAKNAATHIRSRNSDEQSTSSIIGTSFIDARVDFKSFSGSVGRGRHSTRTRRPPRMSTPNFRDRSLLTSPRLKRKARDESSIIVSLPDVPGRQFHEDYDPYIEIRQAHQRLMMYKSDSKSEILLRQSESDLAGYSKKLKRKYTEKGINKEIDIETRQEELLRRQRDIDMGKTTEKYSEYVLKIPKPMRAKCHPRTPNKFRKVSRRGWDGMIKKWRLSIHRYDSMDPDVTYCTTASEMSTAASDSEREEIDVEGDAPQTVASTEIRIMAGEIEEETLQDKVKTKLMVVEDENTMQGDDVRRARSRTVLSPRSGNASDVGPQPDVLHSGVTNDLDCLGLINGKAAFERISAMLSPSKRRAQTGGSPDRKRRAPNGSQ